MSDKIIHLKNVSINLADGMVLTAESATISRVMADTKVTSTKTTVGPSACPIVAFYNNPSSFSTRLIISMRAMTLWDKQLSEEDIKLRDKILSTALVTPAYIKSSGDGVTVYWWDATSVESWDDDTAAIMNSVVSTQEPILISDKCLFVTAHLTPEDINIVEDKIKTGVSDNTRAGVEHILRHERALDMEMDPSKVNYPGIILKWNIYAYSPSASRVFQSVVPLIPGASW